MPTRLRSSREAQTLSGRNLDLDQRKHQADARLLPDSFSRQTLPPAARAASRSKAGARPAVDSVAEGRVGVLAS